MWGIMMRRIFLYGAIASLLMTTTIFAQLTSRLDGTIIDQTGGVIPGASVVLTNQNTGISRTTVSNDQGNYVFPQTPPGVYQIEAELTGFRTAIIRNVRVDVGLPARVDVQLEIGEVTEAVIVSAEGAAMINTVSAELTTVVETAKVVDLPLVSGNPVVLAGLQAGVASRSGATSPRDAFIHGLRGSFNNITHDGINVQDNFVRTGGLFALTAPTFGNVSQFSITTQNVASDSGQGVAQIRMVTPSGSNEIHGSLYNFHRNDYLDANSFFNNAAGLDKAKLIRNAFGGTVGGPVIRDKLFYYGAVELFRERTDAQLTRTVFTQSGRDGIFTWTPPGGSPQQVNLLELGGLTMDPYMQRIIALTPLPNDPTSVDPNFARFRFNSSAPTNTENYTVRVDYNMLDAHRVEGVFQHYDSEFPNDTFNDIGEVFPGLPGGGQASRRQRFSVALQSTYGPTFTNETRYGFQRAPVEFFNSESFADGFVLATTNLPITDPIRTFQPQGRKSPSHDWINNSNWIRGNHAFRFGGSFRSYWADTFNDALIVPTFTLGWGSTNNVNPLSTAMFPGGISGTDFTRASNHLSTLAGTVTRVDQRFNVTSPDSGFVPGATLGRDWRQSMLSFYGGDTWRVRRGLTISYGLRWEYHSPVSENNGLMFLPLGPVLDPNTQIDFFRGDIHAKDLNNFAPNISFAWDPFGDGRTSIRSGYSISYVIDSNLTTVNNATAGNAGLQVTPVLTNLSGTISSGGIITVPTPDFLSPRTQIDQLLTSPAPTVYGIDSDLSVPYVQQWSLSIERKLTNQTAVEVRYVGNRGTKLVRAIDFNQVNILGANGEFLNDFKAAQRNLLANGNPTVGEPIPTFSLLGLGGLLTNATVQNYLRRNEVAELLWLYVNNRDLFFVSPAPALRPGGERFDATIGSDFFFPSNILGIADSVGNISWSTYNALQMEVRRQFSDGLSFQWNYTFSKNLTDFEGSQANFAAFMDNNRHALEKRRSPQDITHVMNANWIYELPFGSGRRFLAGGGVVDKVLGGWQVGGIVNLQSGQPLSIVSARGTYNRAGRSANNTVNLSGIGISDLKARTGEFRLADGRVSMFDASLSGPGGFGSGDLFLFPEAGDVGSLGLTPISGPKYFNFDFNLIKRTYLTEEMNLEFRADMFNIMNRTNFNVGLTQNIQSANFGIINSSFAARVIQLALRLNF
jgi:hypothetical protein